MTRPTVKCQAIYVLVSCRRHYMVLFFSCMVCPVAKLWLRSRSMLLSVPRTIVVSLLFLTQFWTKSHQCVRFLFWQWCNLKQLTNTKTLVCENSHEIWMKQEEETRGITGDRPSCPAMINTTEEGCFVVDKTVEITRRDAEYYCQLFGSNVHLGETDLPHWCFKELNWNVSLPDKNELIATARMIVICILFVWMMTDPVNLLHVQFQLNWSLWFKFQTEIGRFWLKMRVIFLIFTAEAQQGEPHAAAEGRDYCLDWSQWCCWRWPDNVCEEWKTGGSWVVGPCWTCSPQWEVRLPEQPHWWSAHWKLRQ